MQCSVVPAGSPPSYGPCSGGSSSHSASNLKGGSYMFSVRATDGAGNQAVQTRSFSIVPLLAITDMRLTEGNSGSKNAVSTVQLSAQSLQRVTVNYATADGKAKAPGDYTAKGSTTPLAFNPDQTTKTISVAVKGDLRDEPNETFFVRLSGATNASFADALGRATIVDND